MQRARERCREREREMQRARERCREQERDAESKREMQRARDMYRFGKLTARLHYAKAQGNDFCCQQEVDHFLLICFDQGTCQSTRNKL
jgi:galactokinase